MPHHNCYCLLYTSRCVYETDNRIGHRIAIVGNASIPTTWENGRDIIDLQISKTVLKNKGEFKLTVGDLLNQAACLLYTSRCV